MIFGRTSSSDAEHLTYPIHLHGTDTPRVAPVRKYELVIHDGFDLLAE